MWDIGATETLNRLVNDKRPYTPTTGKGVYNVVYGSNMPKKGEAVFGTGGDSRALGDKNKNVNVNAAFPVAQNTNQNISGFPAVKTNTLGVQKTGGVVKTNNSKSSSSSSSLKDAQKKIEKEREAARKAFERQVAEQLGGVGSSAEARLGGLSSAYNSNVQVLQNLLAQIDPTYAEYQRKYQDTMEGNKQKDLNALSAQFAAYGTGDSEQRAQSQERMYNEYQKSYGEYLKELEAQKQSEMTGYRNQQLSMEGEYNRNMGDINAQRLQAEADIRAGKFAGLSDIDTRFNQRQSEAESNFARMAQEAQQQQFDNQIKLASLGRSGAGSQGFTAVQQQEIMSDYNNDLQQSLGKAAYMPQGGREQVYNELLGKYGNILDPESIYNDIFNTYAQPGWEQNYQKMYKNPVQADPYSVLSSMFTQGR